MCKRKKSNGWNPAMKFVVESGSISGSVTGEKDCTQQWRLRLVEFKIPQVGRMMERVEGSYEELRDQLHAREHAIQGISLDVPASAVVVGDATADSSAIPAKSAYVRASIPYGCCPYCGHEQELDYDSWYLLGSEDEMNPCEDEDTSEYLDRQITFEQLEGRTFHKLRECPAGTPTKLSIDAGFEPGTTPLAKLEDCLEHPQQSEGLTARKLHGDDTLHAWWRIGALGQGYCKCNACGNYYHVGTSECTSRGHTDHTPLLEQRYVDVDIAADEEAVTVHFEPAIGINKYSDLRFGIGDGTFEVNGALAFGTRTLSAGEDAQAMMEMPRVLLDDFECEGLWEEIVRLLSKRIEGFDEGLYFVMSAHGTSWGESLEDTVVANRFRGYPPEFYLQAYDPVPLGQFGAKRVRVNASVLPVNYADLEECFEQSCLPDTPPIRAAAFAQPWFIAVAHGFKSMPFRDENVVERLLNDKWALNTLTSLIPFDSVEGTMLEFLCEEYGEDAVCRLFAQEGVLVRPKSWLARLKRRMPAELPAEVDEVLDSMLVQDAAYVLSELEFFGEPDAATCLDLEPFEYPEHVRALEGQMGPVRLGLPERPLDILVASVELSEELAEYTQLMLEEDMNSCALLLARGEDGKLAGAVAVMLWEGTAQLYERRTAAQSDRCRLRVAFEDWMQSQGLSVDES